MSSSSSPSSSIFPPPANTRLVTIIAQVDHGKTTLCDNLISSNGIISERLAGTLRYLDSLEEEQRRGITMRTSAIGLRHAYKQQKTATEQPMVVHLLDSPGHTDFAPEVSSALLCCDAAIIVIDVVEGMCARTHQVLREAYVHELVPILVLNKLDRLCTDLCLTPTEAYVRLRNLLESVNAATAAMLVSQSADYCCETSDEETEQRWTFEPAKGNVVFCSAYHGWGFTVPSLARTLFRSKTLSIKPILLKQCLFGDYKIKQDDDKVLKWKQQQQQQQQNGGESQPLFAEYALAPIWSLYEGVASAASAIGLVSDLFADGRMSSNNMNTSGKDTNNVKLTSSAPGMENVLQAMQVGGTGTSIPTSLEDMQAILNKAGASTEISVLRSLLRRYRPLSDCVLDAVCEHGPSPDVAARSVRTRALALTATRDIDRRISNNSVSCISMRSLGPCCGSRLQVCVDRSKPHS
jgi:ribosome assembly protein 1